MTLFSLRDPLAAFLALTTSASAGVTCNKLGSGIVCNDGSRIDRMGSTTIITRHDKNGVIRTTRCNRLGLSIRCD